MFAIILTDSRQTLLIAFLISFLAVLFFISFSSSFNPLSDLTRLRPLPSFFFSGDTTLSEALRRSRSEVNWVPLAGLHLTLPPSDSSSTSSVELSESSTLASELTD